MRPRAVIKSIGKYQFRNRYWMSVGAGLLYILLAGNTSALQNRNLEDFIPHGWLSIISMIGSLAFLVYILVSPAVEVGYAHFCRCIYNNWITDVKDMFKHGFGDYGRHLGGILFRDLFVFLWSMLFIIPGIVKSYAYFAAPYILAEFPHVRATDAIKISMRMTYGYKADLFVFDLSFLGWRLLFLVPVILFAIFFVNSYSYYGYLYGMGWIILSAFAAAIFEILFVSPYYYTSRAGMYEELKNNALATGAVRIEELTGYTAPPAASPATPPAGQAS